MTTAEIQEIDRDLPTLIELDALTLGDLLTGALVATLKNDNVIALNCVLLTSTGNSLQAVATDRYRLIEGTIKTENAPVFAVMLQRKDIEKIAKAAYSLVKEKVLPYSRNVKITHYLGRVTFQFNSVSISAESQDATFPPYTHLFTEEASAIDSIKLNPELLASLSKIPHIKESGMNITFHGGIKPAKIGLEHASIDWKILLMPMRSN